MEMIRNLQCNCKNIVLITFFIFQFKKLKIYNIVIQLIICFFLITFFNSCQKEEVLLRPFQFTRIAIPSDVPRASAMCVALNNDGYVICGRNPSGILNDVWKYTPDLDKWTRMNNFPEPVRVNGIAVNCNGVIYAGLGFDINFGDLAPQSYLRDFYKYVPDSDKWIKLCDFPSKFSDAAFAFSVNNLVYVSTGYDGVNPTDKTFRYSPQTNTWTQISNLFYTPRSNAVCVSNGRVFAGTGFYYNKNDWYEFDTLAEKWIARAPMPDKGRLSAKGFSIGTSMFVCGGRHWGGDDGGARKTLTSIYEYLPQYNKWTYSGELPGNGKEGAVCFKIKENVYLGLGENEDSYNPDFWRISLNISSGN